MSGVRPLSTLDPRLFLGRDGGLDDGLGVGIQSSFLRGHRLEKRSAGPISTKPEIGLLAVEPSVEPELFHPGRNMDARNEIDQP